MKKPPPCYWAPKKPSAIEHASVFFLAALLLTPLALVQAANCHVDASDGNDANDGGTPATAWRSLEKVNATTNMPLYKNTARPVDERVRDLIGRLTLEEKAILLDHRGPTVERFGIRSISVDAKEGFKLNGQPLKLKGSCMHHDNGPLGAAAARPGAAALATIKARMRANPQTTIRRTAGGDG